MNQATANKMSENFCPPHKESINVLMVEDDDNYYRLMCLLLTTDMETKFEVTRASCLAQAVEHLYQCAPHIILLDLNLPDSSGLNSLLEVQKCSPRAPIIVLTGSETQELGLRSIAEGADDFLVKQKVGAESIVRCVRYAIERRKSEESRLRLLAIQDFTATLAHDLQIPLIGANQVLDGLMSSNNDKLTAEQLQMLRALKVSNTSQLQLVQKLIEIYRYESGDVTLSLTSLDMKEIIGTSESEAADLASEKEIVITTNIAPDLQSVWADRSAMLSVLRSLISNAIKFAKPASTVVIEAENSGSGISLRVRNFGQIISPEDQLQLFDRFWKGVRGKKYVANTGLGLYRCQQILSLHQGNIVCSSSAEEGTTFSVSLPGVV